MWFRFFGMFEMSLFSRSNWLLWWHRRSGVRRNCSNIWRTDIGLISFTYFNRSDYRLSELIKAKLFCVMWKTRLLGEMEKVIMFSRQHLEAGAADSKESNLNSKLSCAMIRRSRLPLRSASQRDFSWFNFLQSLSTMTSEFSFTFRWWQSDNRREASN